MQRLWWSAIGLTLIASCSPKSPVPPPTTEPPPKVRSITVAAASDLKFAFADIVAAFRQKHPDIQVEATFGSSGNFYSQLSNKAPFDIFFSADMDYPQKLIKQGDGLQETEFQYAVGHLGIWVRNDSKLDFTRNGIMALEDPAVQKIAIANPRFAPYGRAAAAALKQSGIYESIKDRLVLGDNVAQTAQFVESGAADAGLIAASLAIGSPLAEKGKFWPLPTDSYPALRQGGVILSWARDRNACEMFCSFVTSKEGRSILGKYGFAPPES